MVNNAPTCYRAPRWPDHGISAKNAQKIPPGRNSGNPRKCSENTPKIPKMGIFGILGVFFGDFWGILGVNSGSQNFGPGGIFWVFSMEVPGRAISGLCSRSGRPH